MHRKELAALMQRAEAVSVGAYLDATPALAEAAGTDTKRIAGVTCLVARRIPEPFLNRALGVGTITDVTPRLLDRIERHYRGSAHLAIATECVPLTQLRVLERRGYAPTDDEQLIYVFDRARLPAVVAVDGLSIERAGPDLAPVYAQTSYDSFRERGPEFVTVVEALVRSRRRGLRAFLGRIDGVPAATGMVFDAGPVAALGNGTVLTAFRGRGLQKALIVHRMRDAAARGKRIFFGETENPVSAHNLEDLGWRLLYRQRTWTRTS